MNTIYIIMRHDEGDKCVKPIYWLKTKRIAEDVVKRLNTTEGLHIVCEDDGSMANICDDDAIWYEYQEVTHYED